MSEHVCTEEGACMPIDKINTWETDLECFRNDEPIFPLFYHKPQRAIPVGS